MVGSVIGGRYELEELVGTGGMSSVFRAYDRLLERRVALKVLHEQYTRDEEHVERFRREARAAAQLNHPGIVTVIDRGEQDGRQFIVFEYVEGETLKDVVEREGPLPVREVIEAGIQIARALGFAHARGVVHRDIKPQNVLLNGDGRAKVSDFGIARALETDGATLTGTVLGTSDYMPPEQARGERVDAVGDVYSLGALLYELLTGEVLFPGDSFLTVAVRQINEPPPSVLGQRPETPLRLAAIVERCLAKDPAERFGSMDELVAELEACLDELGDEPDGDATMIIRRDRASAPPRPRRVRSTRTRRRWPVAALLVVLLAAAAAAAFFVIWDQAEPDGAGRTPARPAGVEAVAAYDPEGGDGEHRELAPNATDGDPATYWTTETYRTFDKSGVGLVLDAGGAVELTRLTVVTDLPGATAEIRVDSSPVGRFERRAAAARTLDESTTFELEDGVKARYYLIWFTALAGDRAHVNEVDAA